MQHLTEFQPSLPHAIALAGTCVLGACVRCYGLESRSLWFDEAFTWLLVQFPLTEMLQRATEDNSPPLYYVVLYAWSAIFGDSAVAMRSLSVLCGVAAVAAMYGLAQELNRLAERKGADDHSLQNIEQNSAVTAHASSGCVEERAISPLLAAGLMATSPFQIVMSAEARPYSMGVLLAILSTWMFVKIAHGMATWPTLITYWAATIAFVYTHHFGWFLVAGQGVYIFASALSQVDWRLADLWKVRPARHVAISIVVVCLAYSLWFPALLKQTEQVRESFWIPPPHILGMASLIYQMFVVPTITIPIKPVDAFTSVILFVMALSCLIRLARRVDRLIVCMIITGLGMPLLYSFMVASIMNPRYFLFMHVFLLLGLARLIETARSGATRRTAALGAMCASLVAYGIYAHRVDLFNETDGFIGVAAYLDEHRTQDDMTVASTHYAFFPLLAHARNKEATKLYVTDQLVHYGGAAALTSQLICSDRLLRAQFRSGESLWLVELEDAVVDLPDGWQRNLRATFDDDFVPGRRLHVFQCEAEPTANR